MRNRTKNDIRSLPDFKSNPYSNPYFNALRWCSQFTIPKCPRLLSFMDIGKANPPPLFLSSNNEVHESEIRPDKLSRTHRTFSNTLLGFLYNKFNGLDFCLFIISFVTYQISCCSPYAPYSRRPRYTSPYIFYIANEIPLYQIPTRRGWRVGKICSNYPRSAILASNPPIFSTPLFFSTINSMNRRAHVNSTIPTHHYNFIFLQIPTT